MSALYVQSVDIIFGKTVFCSLYLSRILSLTHSLCCSLFYASAHLRFQEARVSPKCQKGISSRPNSSYLHDYMCSQLHNIAHSFHPWFEGTQSQDIWSESLLYIMHVLSFLWLFTSIIFVLELLTRNLAHTKKNYNAFISFCAFFKIFAKYTTLSAYNKSMITTWQFLQRLPLQTW